MSQTKEGARKAAETIRRRYTLKQIHEWAAKGGRNGSAGKGFASNRELAAEAGKIGGKISKRRKAR